MAHGYHKLQLWNQWLTQHYLGNYLLSTESRLLSQTLTRHLGKHALLLGVPHQYDLLKSTVIPCHSLLTPLAHLRAKDHIVESDFHELPIMTGGIDLVMLPHTLEFVDNPRQLLAEACRVVKPEGLLVICGFNPYSCWGLKKYLSKKRHQVWAGNFLPAHQIKNWLGLADFQMENQLSGLFRPPLDSPAFFESLRYLEQVGHLCFPIFGGIYVLVARASVIALTPVRLKWKWKQSLGTIRISTTMPGSIARQSK